jgi:hypothetical protein
MKRKRLTEEQFQAQLNSNIEPEKHDLTIYEGLTREEFERMDYNSKSSEYLKGLKAFVIEQKWPLPTKIIYILMDRNEI